MKQLINRHPLWSLAILVVIAFLLWLVIAPWPTGLVATIGRKKVFLNALFNGITLGGLYFLVASGFTLIFGLMRNVNLAHGSLYLLGGYSATRLPSGRVPGRSASWPRSPRWRFWASSSRSRYFAGWRGRICAGPW